jgi:hypothetical protein
MHGDLATDPLVSGNAMSLAQKLLAFAFRTQVFFSFDDLDSAFRTDPVALTRRSHGYPVVEERLHQVGSLRDFERGPILNK